ncbi:MAG TPA: zinc ribbon domain-containing protein [Candidatus Polarisedimenticolia bacterium]|nr:zinc ribbon domain-containing protein [Candidatus Polarisedimenticolia bacterium]
MQCPKCASQASDDAQFCPRCHATLRFKCPSCGHEQPHGGDCDKCGVNFLKYLSAVVASKQIEAEKTHDRNQNRTGLLKAFLWLPLDGGISLMRNLFGVSRNRGSR